MNPSNPAVSLGEGSKPAKDIDIPFLEKFSTENNALKIHNKALNLLKTSHKEPAVLLLKKNAYQNLFPPSYLALFHLGFPVSFAPSLWHSILFFMALVCIFLCAQAFKKPSLPKLKSLFWNLSLFGCIMAGGGFLQKRVSPLQEMDLRSSPFPSAPVQSQTAPLRELVVLKRAKDWLRVQSPDKQIGWIPKQNVFQIF